MDFLSLSEHCQSTEVKAPAEKTVMATFCVLLFHTIVFGFSNSSGGLSVVHSLYVQLYCIAREFKFCSALLCSWLGEH